MASSTEGSVKGSVLVARLAFVRSELGPEALDRVLARLPREDREVMRGIVLSVAWVPFALSERLALAIAAERPDDKGLFRRLGERSARDNLASFHRVYVREHDPHAMLRDAPAIYRLYYDSGRREYHRVSEREAILRTLESNTFSPADCETVAGWYEAAIGICGGAKARVEELRCRTRDDAFCEYRCTWE